MRYLIFLAAIFAGCSPALAQVDLLNCDNPSWNTFGCAIHQNRDEMRGNKYDIGRNAKDIDQIRAMAVTNSEQIRMFERQANSNMAAITALSAVPYQDGTLSLGVGLGSVNSATGYALKMNYKPANNMTFSGGIGGADSEQVYSLGIGYRIK